MHKALTLGLVGRLSRSTNLQLVLLSLIYGSSYLILKKVLGHFNAVEVASGRILLTSFVYLPIAFRFLPTLRSKKVLFISGLALLGLAVPTLLVTTALTEINSSVAGVLSSMVPIWVVIAGATFFSTKFKRLEVGGIAVCLAGILLLFNPFRAGIESVNSFGLLIVLSALIYAGNILFIQKRLQDVPSLAVAAISYLVLFPLALAAVCYSFGTHPQPYSNAEWTAIAIIIGSAVLTNLCGFMLFTHFVKHTSSAKAAMIYYLSPLVATLLGVLDGESLTLGQAFGLLLILAGMVVVTRAKRVRSGNN